MKKSAIISFILFCIFSLTILLNTTLAVDFINTSRNCNLSVNYSEMEIPPLLEEELQSEKNLEKQNFSSEDVMKFTTFYLQNSECYFERILTNNSCLSFHQPDYSINSDHLIHLRNLRI
ncbi:MAG: hypothetical protein ACK452_04380 [Bacteroidota bacterium]|jgi:hypothetical protein